MSPGRGQGKAINFLRDHVAYAGDDCLPWPMSRDTKGYGNFGFEGKHYSAHRYMCELINGPPPTPKHQASHSCGRGHEGCVNPRHLRWKTNGENQKEKAEHGTKNVNTLGKKSKLTPQQIAEIQAKRGIITIMKLAEMYGVKRGTIDRWHRIARDGYDRNAIRPKKAA